MAGFIVLIILVLVGSELFLGQKAPMKVNQNIFNYDESNPYLDRPTREALTHVTEKTDDDLDIITDGNGFDNFEIGVDFAEQMLVTNPTNPLNMQFGVNSSATGQNAYYTTNGYDWTQSNPSYNSSICCDPWSAWDGLGRLVYGSGVSNEYVYRSSTGATYTPAGGTLAVSGSDRNTLAAEQTGTGPYANYFYAAITPGNFARSMDGGVTWATTYSPSNTIPGTMIAVGPNGATNGGCVMYVTNTGSTENVTYTFHRSLDGGATFTVRSSLATAGYVGTLNSVGRLVINNGRTRPYPMIAMDNSSGAYRGRLYLVYASNVPAGNGNKPDIRLRYSTDQGATWSAGVTVNDNANPQLSDQWFPAIWCEKTTGRLYIKWYDDRENPAAFTTNVYATYSDDGGATFAANQKLTTASWTWPNPSCAANTNCYRGDYDGMTANPKTGYAVWYDGRLGTYKNVGAYFPDFGMLATPASNTVHQTNSSVDYTINIPAVKLYTDVTTFSATVTPAPSTGSFAFEFPGGNTLSSYPNTKTIKVKTVGTVTPLGNYTVTITGQGSNGTPVHKRSVTVTVNTTVGPTPCESFSGTDFPPVNFYEEYTGATNYWSRQTPSAYGIGAGSAKFDFYSAGPLTGGSITQSLVTNNFAAVAANTYLTFDEAYAPYQSNFGPDTLVLEISSNFGASYSVLKTLLGKYDGSGELNSAPPAISAFSPINSQWRSKIYLLPVGTNKIRLKAQSGYGNNLYLDNICIQTLSLPLANTIGLASEGMFINIDPYWRLQDTVRVYLHRTDFPNIIVDSAINTMGSNAISNSLLFSNALTGTYYKVVKHRNSIETWSNAGISYTRGSNVNFNFIQPDGQAYGNNQAIVNISPLYRGMFSGDLNDDGIIDGTDVSSVDNAALLGLSGYVIEDVTGDNYVDATDAAIVDNNAFNGVAVVAPPGAEPVVNPQETDRNPEFKNEAERQKYESGIKANEIIKMKEAEILRNKETANEYFTKMYKGKNRKKSVNKPVDNMNHQNLIHGNAGE
jgi:hypothetical protein